MTAAGRDLRHLARLHGVATAFTDGTGAHREVAAPTLLAVLRCLGAPVESLRDVSDALVARRREIVERVIEPVLVSSEASPVRARLRVPARALASPWRAWLRLPDHEALVGSGRVSDLPTAPPGHRDGTSSRLLTLVPGEPLPPGEHALTVEVGSAVHRSLLLVAPSPAAPGPRRWGVFQPLHAIWREPGGAMGDLGALEEVVAWTAGLGGSFVGMLPALAAHPGEVSPYSPISRMFWNELYLEPPPGEPMPERGNAPAVDALADLAGPEGGRPREHLPPGREVDVERAWRRSAARVDGWLQWMARPEAAEARSQLESWIARHPRARSWAAYRALADVHGHDWWRWPEHLREPRDARALAPPGAARRHLVAQWLLEKRWRQIAGSARERGVDLYLDLPVGVPSASFDGWLYRDELLRGCHIGAPPDVHFPEGQDWGLAPPHPGRQRRGGYAQLRGALAHHLQVARLLRIDHVMGLRRLYWVPEGASPVEGTYVRYPAAEQNAIVAIEAWRRGATIVGEDLGTVPDAVRRDMKRHGMRRMVIGLAEMGQDPVGALEAPPASSLASMSTHDMPTFCGWWRDLDVHRRADLGRLPRSRIEADKAARQPAKEALLRGLAGRGRLDGLEPERILDALQGVLAASSAELLMVNPDEMLGETLAQNLPGPPGTGDVDAACWRLRSVRSLDALLDDPDLRARLERIDRLRREPS